MGYFEMIKRLEGWLCAVTGFAAASLQPNAGSQGEFAGLLAIRAWHGARGDTRSATSASSRPRAHGTNPASAVMAGMKVVVVGCDRDGNVDLGRPEGQGGAARGDRLAALMITYPSTHGVFEEEIRAICDLVHAHGGQVYMDGANMNAQVGLTSPAADRRRCLPPEPAQDLLHPAWRRRALVSGRSASRRTWRRTCRTTRCIPGAGPATGYGPVSAAPFGSAAILPISYAYIRMMGAEGLTRATQVAILNANYVARRLEAHYPVLYRGLSAAWWRMNASSTAAASSKAAACWSRTSPSGCRIMATTRRPCPGRWRAR